MYRWIADEVVSTVTVDGNVRIPAEQLDRVVPPTRNRTPATTGEVTQHVLDAALSVLAAQGHVGFTIEQVAAKAGMSVGGVTYHYPTKAALVDGLVDAFLERFEADWADARRAGASVADAYIDVSLTGPREQRTRALLLAALDQPETTRRIDRRVKRWYRQIADASDGSADSDADVQRCMAADAVWLFGLLGLRPVTSSAARRIVGRPNR
jgi:AcrR family transcriptional regulator